MFFARFHPEHLDYLRVQSAQSIELGNVSAADVEVLRNSFAYSAFDGARCLACAGLVPIWRGRAVAWALLSGECGRHMLAITRFARFALSTYPCDRVEATVLADFEVGHKWMRLLGFEREDRDGLRKYDTLGRTFALYARVKQ